MRDSSHSNAAAREDSGRRTGVRTAEESENRQPTHPRKVAVNEKALCGLRDQKRQHAKLKMKNRQVYTDSDEGVRGSGRRAVILEILSETGPNATS